MRKNKHVRTNLKVYSVYIVYGLNLDSLINRLQKNQITLYLVKKLSPKKMRVAVKVKEREKFFAITKELCYTIRYEKNIGRDRSLFFLLQNLGIVCGAIIFTAISVFLSDRIFAFNFTGNGSVYKGEILQFLSQENIDVFSQFSKIDTDALSNKILASTDSLLFCECSKKGNRLVIYSVVKEKDTKILTGKETALVSTVSGTIKELKVYRGNSLVNVGDSVKSGQILVDGNVLDGETVFNTNVIAVAKILVKETFYYFSNEDNKEDYAEILCQEKYTEKLNPQFSLTKTFVDNNYVYKIDVSFIVINYIG